MPFTDPNYTQIPNDLLGNDEEPGLMARMGLAELKVVLALCRMTFGFHRARARVSLTKLQKMTGLSRQGVVDGAKRARERELVEKENVKGVSLWVVKRTSQANRLVKLVDQISPDGLVKPVDRTSQASRPPSNKETLKKEHSKDSAPSTVRADTPEAVKVFRAAAHRFPPKAWYLDIASRVGGEEEDLIRWGEHVKSWVGRGYNPTNIEGILESFEEGGLKKRKRPRDDRPEETSAGRRARRAGWIDLMNKGRQADADG